MQNPGAAGDHTGPPGVALSGLGSPWGRLRGGSGYSGVARGSPGVGLRWRMGGDQGVAERLPLGGDVRLQQLGGRAQRGGRENPSVLIRFAGENFDAQAKKNRKPEPILLISPV